MSEVNDTSDYMDTSSSSSYSGSASSCNNSISISNNSSSSSSSSSQPMSADQLLLDEPVMTTNSATNAAACQSTTVDLSTRIDIIERKLDFVSSQIGDLSERIFPTKKPRQRCERSCNAQTLVGTASTSKPATATRTRKSTVSTSNTIDKAIASPSKLLDFNVTHKPSSMNRMVNKNTAGPSLPKTAVSAAVVDGHGLSWGSWKPRTYAQLSPYLQRKLRDYTHSRFLPSSSERLRTNLQLAYFHHKAFELKSAIPGTEGLDQQKQRGKKKKRVGIARQIFEAGCKDGMWTPTKGCCAYGVPEETDVKAYIAKKLENTGIDNRYRLTSASIE